MDPVTINSPRLDHMDAEQFRTMQASPSFALLTARLTKELERSRESCEREEDPSIIYRAQGAVGALRSVLAMPAIILAEMEKRKR